MEIRVETPRPHIALVTIANAAPKNLVHCLCQNGTYETNGAVQIPGRGTVSFTGLAREAGYPRTYAFDDGAAWDRAVPAILRQDGPIFVDLRMEPGEPYPEDFRRLYDVELQAEDFVTMLERASAVEISTRSLAFIECEGRSRRLEERSRPARRIRPAFGEQEASLERDVVLPQRQGKCCDLLVHAQGRFVERICLVGDRHE